MPTLGRVSFALGLLLLLSSPLTLFVTGSAIAAGIKAAAGLLLITLWVLFRNKARQGAASPAPKPGSASEAERPMSQLARASFFYVSSTIMVVLALAALGAANFIAARRDKTWDLTDKKIHSLSPQTQGVLKRLTEPVKAIGFLAPGHPALDALDELLRRYRSESEKFSFEIKDPRKNPELAAKYQLREGQTTVVISRGEGEAASHTAIGVISEQELTNALVKLEKVGEQKIYYVVGHGEWPLEQGPPDPTGQSPSSASQFRKNLLQEGYSPEELNLSERPEIPRDASALIIAGARSPFSDGEKALLEQYLEQGGRLLYFAELKAEPGLDALLAKYGLMVDQGLVADDKVNPLNPYVVVTPSLADHEITRYLKLAKVNIELATCRGLSVLREGQLSGVVVTPLVVSSPYAWVETNLEENPSLSDGEKAGAIPLVAVSTRGTSGAQDKRFDEARLVVFGDSELLTDSLWGHEADRNLVLNSLAWASSQVDKITIRPPDREASAIEMDANTFTRLQFLTIDLLPLSLIALGLVIWISRRGK